MINQAVSSIKLTFYCYSTVFLFFLVEVSLIDQTAWFTRLLYVVTSNCVKIRTSKKPSKLYNYQLKGLRSCFLTQKESGSE